MANFFKSFGKGILYILVLPVLLIALAVYLVISIFVFIFLFIKSVVLFFAGHSLHEDLPEDIEAKKRLATLSQQDNNANPVSHVEGEVNTIISNNVDSSISLSNDPFYTPEYLRQEIKHDEVEQINVQSEDNKEVERIDLNLSREENNVPSNEPTQIENKEVAPMVKEEVINTPVTPVNNIKHDDDIEIMDDDEDNDEDDNSGVKIEF